MLPPAARTPRTPHVTAVLVAHDGQAWLPRVRSGLAAATRRPDRLVAVDTGSTDRTPELLADGDWVDEVVTLERDAGFGTALTAGLDYDANAVIDLTDQSAVIDLTDDRAEPADAADEWLWLLHDDAAPAPDALERLLAAAARHPDADVLGPKLRGWRRDDVILECGVALSGTGRRETGIVTGEVDQGQHDDRLDVMAVSSAGMLVRRSLWDRLGGFAAAFPVLGDDADFCWRAHRAGARVIAVPDAVVYHRQALSDHLRDCDVTGRTLRFEHRRAAVVTALIHAPRWRLPFTAARCLLGAVLRVLFHLVMLSPRRAWDDLTGTFVGLLSWRAIRTGRGAERSPDVTTADLRQLRPTLAQRWIGWQESLSRHQGSTSALEAARSRRWGVVLRLSAVVAVVVGVVCLVATWNLWFGDGRLAGGALLPAPDSVVDIGRFFLAPWHEVGLGSAVPAPPYLLLVGVGAVPLLGSAGAATQVLLLLGPVLAGLAAAAALRGVVSRPTMVVAGITYGLLPATVTAVGTGRIGTTLAAVALPGTVRLLLRVTGIATPLPPARTRTVAGAALATAALGSVAPALAVVLIVLAGATSVFIRHGRGLVRVVVVAVATVALLWPWSGYVIANPALLLGEAGAHPAALGAEAIPVWSLAVLDPGGPTAPPAGLAAVVMVLAVAALIPSATRRAVVGAWLLVLAGLLLGIGTVLVTVTLPSTTVATHPWPGAATLLAGTGALLAIATAATGVPRGRKSRLVGRLALLLCLVTPALVGGWWITSGRSMLDRVEPGVVSAYVTEASLAPEAPRTLVLSGRADKAVSYQLLSGAGPRLGDADVAPAAETMAPIDRAVGDLVAGGSEAAVATLRQASVRFLAVDTKADAALARQLDAVPGVRRLSTLDRQALWEVDGWLPRVRALTPQGPEVIPADPAGPTLSASGPLPAGATAIELAETRSELWRATVADTALAPADGQWETFAVPSGASGDVEVDAAGTPRLAALLVPTAALLVLIGMALRPAARRERKQGGRKKRKRALRVEQQRERNVGLEVLS